MPLLKTLKLGNLASILIWKIDENENELLKDIRLHKSDRHKYEKLHHPVKRCEFLALRSCLRSYFGQNPEVFYEPSGKPFLQNGKHISFSHTRGFAGMIISPSHRVGLDVEAYREGIRRIAPKFMRTEEQISVLEATEVEHLTHYWGAKEVMVKVTGNRRLNFKQELRVAPFSHAQFQETTGLIHTREYTKKVKLYFKTINNLHLSFGWEL